jgi:HEPN domain-containing protein
VDRPCGAGSSRGDSHGRRTAGGVSLFHCQQAAEKYLKAFLTWKQTPFRKTHELRELGSLCGEADPSLIAVLEPACALSAYAWRFRYPGAPYEPAEDEARRAIILAEGVRAEIRARLPETAVESGLRH